MNPNPKHAVPHSAGTTGRPEYLIGPRLFPIWRHLLTKLMTIVLPVVAVVLAGAQLIGGAEYLDAVIGGVADAMWAGFWLVLLVTAVFAFIERAEMARDARADIAEASGRWTGMASRTVQDGPGVRGMLSGLITTIVTIGGLMFLRDTTWFTEGAAPGITILEPEVSALWVPILIGSLVALSAFQVAVHLKRRWTVPLAVGHVAMRLAFGLPVVWLAVSGRLVNPAFAERIGVPELAHGDGWTMMSLAAAVVLITAWEILIVVRRARRPAIGQPVS
jgi:hypothetical protein